jgi:hypothetical protein
MRPAYLARQFTWFAPDHRPVAELVDGAAPAQEAKAVAQRRIDAVVCDDPYPDTAAVTEQTE